MKIKQLRKMNGLSQSAFAKKLGIAQNTLSQYETGQRKIPPELLRKISDTYNTTTDYLLDADQICDDRLGPALKDERQFQKLSLKQVSIDTKIPLKDLSNYENNLEPVNLYIFKILCKYFGKSTYEFYNDHEMYDEYIPEIFNGDVDKYEQFKEACKIDAQKDNGKKSLNNSVNLQPNKSSTKFITLYRKYTQLPENQQKLVEEVINGFLPKKPKEALPDDDDLD